MTSYSDDVYLATVYLLCMLLLRGFITGIRAMDDDSEGGKVYYLFWMGPSGISECWIKLLIFLDGELIER